MKRKNMIEINKIYNEPCLDTVSRMSDNTIDCVITSPPYWQLRDYGYEGQWGLEPTYNEYLEHLWSLMDAIYPKLKDGGTVWVNLGDTYMNNSSYCEKGGQGYRNDKNGMIYKKDDNIKQKSLCLIPHRFAIGCISPKWILRDDLTEEEKEYVIKEMIFELSEIPQHLRKYFTPKHKQWIMRNDVIWCLSGGTWVYAKTQKGEMPMMIKDIARLDPKTVKLWNGEKWTQLLGMSRSERKGDEIELVLRSGERISCTPTHKFPTDKGLKEAKDITIGDVLQFCRLPEPEQPRDCVIDEDAAWLAGLYIAEGSMAGDTIQIAGHTKEIERWERLQKIANKYGGSITRTIDGNKMDIRMYGKVLVAILSELVSGKTAKNKCFAPVVWRYSNKFIESMLDGYLSGDGHYEKQNDRWRLGFTRNYNLERDLRTACSRLGYRLTLNLSTVLYNGRQLPTFRGEIRKTRSGHFNEKNMGEVLEINKSRCRYVWDIGVENEPHLFALASGILTHNSKPNAMPESVTDRFSKKHEYFFFMVKSEKYYFDLDAIRDKSKPLNRWGGQKLVAKGKSNWDSGTGQQTYRNRDMQPNNGMKNPGSVSDFWDIPTKPSSAKHYASYNDSLLVKPILAGCPKDGIIYDPFMGTGSTAEAAIRAGRRFIGSEMSEDYVKIAEERLDPFLRQLTLF